MYQVNEIILYGSEGICKIDNMMTRHVNGQPIEYYVLKPIKSESSTIYVPTLNEELTKKMKRVLSYQEIIDLIHFIPDSELLWIDNDNLRKERYKGILRDGNRQEIMQLIRTLYLHQLKLKEEGKKFHASDDKFYKDAERILYEEFAYVLNISEEEVVPFICQEIDVKEIA
ncbi:MAG: CarD family transcriptional regulator [Longibaculum muris]|uniref:CarD family transcriptional regulator n=1 Tax=Longibaculum muris TaxID=1796628 RepID=A0A4R3Z5B1_9FIRM|nr:CarD family transcriptional regulator [Longibaculum muris]KXU46862.1 CarD-like protein [Candidatus Stoquefichus sp. KLE1796]MBS5368764.1 CarD family transcriptional regulator [Coprobacillus cateniformis]MCR1888317.1 CarD family transcriptional regulator [Longibaculum muris]MED9812834.1 CarD family transcriptional regulator [Longibaculum muris]TCW00541.1 CarD family transcriptional regulator [Longibaculum muris]